MPTYHGRNGRFTSAGSAHTVTKDGERFRMVRQLRRIGGKPEAPQEPEDDVLDTVEEAKAKQMMASFVTAAPGWKLLDDVVDAAFGDGVVVEGGAGPRKVAWGKTADGVKVVLWDDGSITGAMGYELKGFRMVRPRTKRGVAVQAGTMFLDDLSLYDLSELGDAYKAYRWAAEKGKTHGEARAKFSGKGERAAKGKLIPDWHVVSADRDGRPKERVWRLPRIRWPGLAVWDHGGKWAGGRERYELMNVDRGGTAKTTGVTFRNMQELEKHLFKM